MSKRNVGDALADMARYSATAVRLVGTMTLDELQADERTSLALERAIEILGDAAARCRRTGATVVPICRGAR